MTCSCCLCVRPRCPLASLAWPIKGVARMPELVNKSTISWTTSRKLQNTMARVVCAVSRAKCILRTCSIFLIFGCTKRNGFARTRSMPFIKSLKAGLLELSILSCFFPRASGPHDSITRSQNTRTDCSLRYCMFWAMIAIL